MRDSKNDVKHEQNKSKIPKNQTQSKIVHKIPPQLKRLRAKLQDSKTWYRAIFDNSNDAIFLIEADRFIDCNPKTLEMFGCTKEQIIDQTPYDRFSPKLQPDNQSSKEKALEKIRLALEGQPQSFEWRHLRYDGTPFEVEVSLNRVEFSGHFYLLSSVRDITKQKHTYIQYDMILKTATDGFCILDAHGRILEVNDAYCEMVDYSREELLSMNLVDVEALESAERVKKHIQKLMNSGSQKFETRHRRKDGKFIDLEVSANNLKLDGHRLFAFFRDITERKKAEVDVRQERDKAQKYLDVAGVMFVALDKEGVVTLINQKGCQILSCDEKNIFGKNWFDNFLPKEVGKKAKHIFEKLMIGELESVEYYENPVLTKSGEERQIAWHNSLLKNEDGRIVGTLSSGEDITERKKADKELLRARQDWENIFQAIGQPSFILDPQHKIITANRATVKKAGIALEQLKGKQCSELLHGKERPPKECPMEKMLCSGCAETVEMEIEAFGGIFLVSCTPVCDTKGRIEKVIHIIKNENLKLKSITFKKPTLDDVFLHYCGEHL